MLELATVVNGKPIRVDLHQVRLPGSNILATKLAQPDLYRELAKLKIPNVAAHMGWQQLCLQLAAFQRVQQDEQEAAQS